MRSPSMWKRALLATATLVACNPTCDQSLDLCSGLTLQLSIPLISGADKNYEVRLDAQLPRRWNDASEEVFMRDTIIPIMANYCKVLHTELHAWVPPSLLRNDTCVGSLVNLIVRELHCACEATLRRDSDHFSAFEAEMGYAATLNALEAQAKRSERMEGSLWTADHSAQSDFANDLRSHKRECLLSGLELTAPEHVIEIGFNAGQSVVLAASVLAPGSRLTSFDLCSHAYTLKAARGAEIRKAVQKASIDFQLYCGNSTLTVPSAYASTATTLPRADFVHVDGGHDLETALADIRNLAQTPGLSQPRNRTVVVVDDCRQSFYGWEPENAVTWAWRLAVEAGYVVPLKLKTERCWEAQCWGHVVSR